MTTLRFSSSTSPDMYIYGGERNAARCCLIYDEKLEGLLVQLKDPSDRESLLSAIKELHDSDAEATSMAAEKDDSSSMRAAVETRIVVDLYAEALDQWLREAIELDSEAEWWDNVGRTYTSVLSYLLASELFKFSSFDP
jgi:nuclear control of ATPase protein 2